MILKPGAWAAAAVITVALSTATLSPTTDWEPVAKPKPGRADLQVALRTQGACGAFGDSIPPIILASGVASGITTDPVTVCIANRSTVGGRVVLSVIERADRETACSPGEEAADATCGANLQGEISAHLIQLVGRDARCLNPSPVAQELPFTSLDSSPVPLFDSVRRGETVCVTLAVRYQPGVDESATQTDAVTWRYAFDFASND